MQHTITATKAREKFSEIINRVLYLNEEFIVQKQGKPAAIIMKADKQILNKKSKASTNDFLLKLTSYNLKGGPNDLAQNHDKYTWE